MKEESVEILQKAMDIEEFGYDYYTKLRSAVKDKQGEALLGYLANAEMEHKERLGGMFNQLGGKAKETETEIDTLIADILMDEGMERIFRGLMEKSELEKVDAIEAVKLGIDVEKKSIGFYSANAKKSHEPDVTTLFIELSSMEKEHLELLEENLRNLKDEGVWYGYIPILD